MGRVADRIAALGLTLPGPHPPHHPLAAVVLHEGIARTSGQLPRIAGELTCIGVLGATVSVEEGREAAKVCALNALWCWPMNSASSIGSRGSSRLPVSSRPHQALTNSPRLS